MTHLHDPSSNVISSPDLRDEFCRAWATQWNIKNQFVICWNFMYSNTNPCLDYFPAWLNDAAATWRRTSSNEQTKWWFFLVDISSLDLNSAMIYAASRGFYFIYFWLNNDYSSSFSIQCEAIIDVPQ